MKYRIEITEHQTEDILIFAKESSPVLEKIEALLRETDTVFGYGNNAVIKLNEENTDCFFVEESKVYALTGEGKFLTKERLYRLETVFGDRFVKINQSCLVNVSKIKQFEVSVGGALMVVLKNGYRDYVSRRQLKTVKERLGLSL